MQDTTEVQTVATAKLKFDETYQIRQDLPSIDDYAEILKASPEVWPFPPIEVVRIGRSVKVVQGFTRGRAALATGRETVEVRMIDGGHDEALAIALRANHDHGYRRTNADKHKAVLRAIGEYPKDSAAKIAKRCNVSTVYARSIRKGLEQDQYSEPETLSLTPCPACQANDWIEKDSGITCAVCHHSHGTPYGPEKPEAKEEHEDNSEIAQDSPERPTIEPSQPTGGKIDNTLNAAIAGIADIGRITRAAEYLGVLNEVSGYIDAISKVFARKKSQCQTKTT